MIDAGRRTPLAGLLVVLTLVAALALPVAAGAEGVPVAGQNVNMVSGTGWPGGDPFLQRQNEPSIAVSTRNPAHLLAGANDYRTVDIPGLDGDEVGDAWLGVFKSFDGGQTWRSTLLPGYPQEPAGSPGRLSPIFGYKAAADPVLRAGTDGLFYYGGITFNRGTNLGQVFVSRFIDQNDRESGSATAATPKDPIQYVDTVVLDTGTSGQFLDKPWLAVDIPRAGATACTISGQPAGNVYMAYAKFTGSNSQNSQVLFMRSTDCGKTWTRPMKISPNDHKNQGTSIAIDPVDRRDLRRVPPVRDEQQQPGRDRRHEVDGPRQDVQRRASTPRSSSPSTRTRRRPRASAPRAFPRSRCRSTRAGRAASTSRGPSATRRMPTHGSSSGPRPTASAGRRRP